ncbi:SDR family NAD(P)-dependent oxidoreductase [Tunicatimonas pelagia]|uniref:SDR family NAD(P)-dependent oxidoreductase n=1 Tax=Tunicatimonas pelagia TaxID=931531 RepID=UPI002665B939|nr:3-oxoacyl-ACP reductase FabG [Tunicatimonas pelagia]WKN41476.1 SDR family oxidoreductase [Tunicatimonas pelagia]
MNNKVALVTGASSGIGKAVALAYAKQGAKVVVANRRKEKGEETVAEIRQAGGEAAAYAVDISKANQVESLIKFVVEKYGQLDYACNNAGVSGDLVPLADCTEENWQHVIQINLSGIFHSMKYEIPELLKTGGSIVNITSVMGQLGMPYAAAYSASKHGIIGLTKSAALEYAAQGIRINALGPAFIQTPLLDVLGEEAVDQLRQKHPIGRLGTPEEVAEMVIWLSSEKASFATGSYYPLDGGYMAQ